MVCSELKFYVGGSQFVCKKQINYFKVFMNFELNYFI
jgi:hypothetical protein